MKVSASPASPRLPQLGAGARRARGAMVAVGNVQRRNARESVHQLRWPPRPPTRQIVWCTPSSAREVVERRVGGDGAAQPIDRRRRAVGQEHDAGLRAAAR